MKVKWVTRSYINNKPIEEYTREEINNFFYSAWDRGFRAIGYTTEDNKEAIERYKQEALKHHIEFEIKEGKITYGKHNN